MRVRDPVNHLCSSTLGMCPLAQGSSNQGRSICAAVYVTPLHVATTSQSLPCLCVNTLTVPCSDKDTDHTRDQRFTVGGKTLCSFQASSARHGSASNQWRRASPISVIHYDALLLLCRHESCSSSRQPLKSDNIIMSNEYILAVRDFQSTAIYSDKRTPP